MTVNDVGVRMGIRGFRRLSKHSVVVEHLDGSARPATDLEQRMWIALGGVVDGVRAKA